MVRMIGEVQVMPGLMPDKVDITREVGLFNSRILNGGECMIRDLVDSAIHFKVPVVAAPQIGYYSDAMAIIIGTACVPMLNPVLRRTGGKWRRYSDGHYYYSRVVLSFYTVDGREYEVSFSKSDAISAQRGLRLLGNKSLTIH